MNARNIIDSNRRKTSNILQFPENIGHHGMLMVFRKYKYVRPGERGLNSPSSVEPTISNSIFLPIPSNLTDTNDINIEKHDMGIIGEGIADKISGFMTTQKELDLKNIINATVSAVPVNMDKIANAISSGDFKDLSRDAAFLARNVLGSGITRNIDIGSGSTPNPKSSLIFSGVNMKPHNFSWQFMPRSMNESELLRQIIQVLHQNVLPTYGEGLGLERIYLNYPSTVDLYLFGVDENHFMKFKTSMVRSLEVNYTPEGRVSILRGGKPAAVQLSISMLEMDIHTAEDYA